MLLWSADESASVVHCDAEHRRWLLVGDAAFGLPFFRALNDGLLCVTELTRCIAKDYTKNVDANSGVSSAADAASAHVGCDGGISAHCGSLSIASIGAVSGSLGMIDTAGLLVQEDNDPLEQYSSFFKALTRKERLFVGVKATVVGSAVKSFGATRATKHSATRSVKKSANKRKVTEGIPPNSD